MKKLFLISLVLSAQLSASEWSYKNQNSWDFVSGKFQSPINIEYSEIRQSKNLEPIRMRFKDLTPASIVDNGHAIEVEAKGNYSEINGRSFSLLQAHFHSLSEHTFDNRHFPIEGHFVHQAEDGRLAVIGVMYVEGKHNFEFEKILANISKKTGREDVKIDYSKLVPRSKDYIHYLGSLTTPPLTENVEWYLLNNPVEVSKNQIERFKQYYNGNYRKTQPINGRPILYKK